jgi:hypothetical protein
LENFTAIDWGGQGALPVLQHLRSIGLCQFGDQLGFVVCLGLGHQVFEFSLGNLQYPVFVKPALELWHQGPGFRTASQRFTQPAHDITPLVFRHHLESQRLVRQLLMV